MMLQCRLILERVANGRIAFQRERSVVSILRATRIHSGSRLSSSHRGDAEPLTHAAIIGIWRSASKALRAPFSFDLMLEPALGRAMRRSTQSYTFFRAAASRVSSGFYCEAGSDFCALGLSAPCTLATRQRGIQSLASRVDPVARPPTRILDGIRFPRKVVERKEAILVQISV